MRHKVFGDGSDVHQMLVDCPKGEHFRIMNADLEILVGEVKEQLWIGVVIWGNNSPHNGWHQMEPLVFVHLQKIVYQLDGMFDWQLWIDFLDNFVVGFYLGEVGIVSEMGQREVCRYGVKDCFFAEQKFQESATAAH